jgi:hypothetical protein
MGFKKFVYGVANQVFSAVGEQNFASWIDINQE